MGFSAYQVVYIEQDNTRLYGELVQEMAVRKTCWLRPVSLWLEADATGEMSLLDVRNGPDIICSNDLIQPVLDTDWVQLIEEMAKTQLACSYSEANQYLRQFLERLFKK